MINNKVSADSLNLPKSVLFISGEDLTFDCVRYRCYHHQEQLALAGIPSVVEWIGSPAIDLNHDLIFLHRVVYDNHVARIVSRVKELGKILVYETDDLVFEPDLIRYLGYKFGKKTDILDSWMPIVQEGNLKTLEVCDCCVVSTDSLANRVRHRGKEVYVVRNAFSSDEFDLARKVWRQPTGAGGRIVLGYMSGTQTHNWDFAEIAEVLACIMRKYRHVYLQITGPLQLPAELLEFGYRVRHVPLVPLRYCFQVYGSLDINLAPLQLREPFCQSKSEIKFVEAGMVGVPTVASATESYCHAIDSGKTGLLAVNHEEWMSALESLVQKPDEIDRLGRNANAYVLEDYSPAKRSGELLMTISLIMERFGKASPMRNMGAKDKTLVHRSDFGFPPGRRPRLFPFSLAALKFLIILSRRIVKYEGCIGLLRYLAHVNPIRKILTKLKNS
jgi:glycosyltransferase involved in cell wall biosynthesis